MRKLGILLLVATGCSVDIEVASVAFTSPAPGSTFTRDQLGPTGALVADIDVSLDVHGDIARVGISAGNATIGDADATGVLLAPVAAAGPTTLTALAYDDAGEVLA